MWGEAAVAYGLMAATFDVYWNGRQHSLSAPVWFWKLNILDGSYQGISFNMYWALLVVGTLPGIRAAKAILWCSMSQTPGRTHTHTGEHTGEHTHTPLTQFPLSANS